ncbi:MAG TPA: ArsA family ATPase [Candidatus Bathyarchaeia archaeon]|nr:ArsA family ATPase [Candidatus Bathyarchaeia archaeon]
MQASTPGLPFSKFVADKKDLRYLFFGGKGGVGKTAVAGATAYYLSQRLGRKTLISSTNPVHSLSSLFGQDLWKKGIQKIQGTKNLSAVEIDVSSTIERYKDEIKERLVQFLKFADIPVDVAPFIEIATTNPAFEESAMFDDMIGLILSEKFDAYVFDTAPVAHTYRLLGMSKVYNLWLNKMIRSREESMSLRAKLSFRKEKIIQELKKDPLLVSLAGTRKKTEEARGLLTDSSKTAFFFVTLPLALPIAVIERFITWVQAFQIPIGGVIVNEVIPIADSTNLSSYVANRMQEQAGYVKLAEEKFPGMIRSILPLYEKEVNGLEMVSRMAEDLGLGSEMKIQPISSH